jgi:CRP-like cAMP-binding protein
MTDRYESALIASPLFSSFTIDGARSVLKSGEVITLPAGELLFAEGGEPDSVIFLLEGEVETFVMRDGNERVFGQLGPGALIGELAVLGEAPRAASVRVVKPATVLKWDDRGFRRLLLRIPQLSRAVFRQALKVVLDHQQALIDELAKAQNS